MKKAIATKPNQPTKYVDLTLEEIAEREAEHAQFILEQPMQEWVSAMTASDNILLRYAEDIIFAMSDVDRSKISIETMVKYNEKKALRAKKP